MNQRGLFDPPPGETRKEQGIDLVMDNEDDNWKDCAYALLLGMVGSFDTVTAADFRLAAAMVGIGEPHHPNCWGGVFSRAAKSGLIVRIDDCKSKVATAHARRIGVWKRKEEDEE